MNEFHILPYIDGERLTPEQEEKAYRCFLLLADSTHDNMHVDYGLDLNEPEIKLIFKLYADAGVGHAITAHMPYWFNNDKFAGWLLESNQYINKETAKNISELLEEFVLHEENSRLCKDCPYDIKYESYGVATNIATCLRIYLKYLDLNKLYIKAC